MTSMIQTSLKQSSIQCNSKAANPVIPSIGRFCGPKIGRNCTIFTTLKDYKQRLLDYFGPTVQFKNYEYENTAISKLANATLKIEKNVNKTCYVFTSGIKSIRGTIYGTSYSDLMSDDNRTKLEIRVVAVQTDKSTNYN